MIEKILEHNSFGTKEQILYIIHLLSKNKLSIDELYEACSSKDYSFNRTFDGILVFLSWINIIEDDEIISLSQKITKKDFLQEIILRTINKLIEEKKIYNFLNSKNIFYIKEKNLVVVKNNLIHISFSAFRNLFVEIGLFVKDSLVENQFLISNEQVEWFKKDIIPLIDEREFNTMSLNDLEILQQKQKELGYEAELFVLEYEKKMRINHPNYSSIKIISELNVNAGYDILSYQTDTSILIDKFIEVKSFSGKESFFWSRNEIDIAKLKEDEYFLYLVDRSKMNCENYIPTIIQNPYKTVLNNDNWKKRIEKYFITT